MTGVAHAVHLSVLPLEREWYNLSPCTNLLMRAGLVVMSFRGPCRDSSVGRAGRQVTGNTKVRLLQAAGPLQPGRSS